MKVHKKKMTACAFFDEKTYYQNKLQNNYETTFWACKVGARKRYDAVTSYVDFSAYSVLDVGCGNGALLRRVVDKRIKPLRYTGIDVVPEFISHAISSGIPGDFILGDVLDEHFVSPSSDWVISVGIFGHKQKTEGIWAERFDQIVKFMWRNARTGIAFTLTSTRSPNRKEDAHYCNPCRALNYAQKELSLSTILDHSYLRNDFLIIAKKDAR